MKPLILVFVASLLAGTALPARADSLRCSGGFADVGYSRLSVLYKCGEPTLADSYCSPVYYAPGAPYLPAPLAGPGIPCLVVDEWIYDRGPGNLTATVRFMWGRVQSISYGRVPR